MNEEIDFVGLGDCGFNARDDRSGWITRNRENFGRATFAGLDVLRYNIREGATDVSGDVGIVWWVESGNSSEVQSGTDRVGPVKFGPTLIPAG